MVIAATPHGMPTTRCCSLLYAYRANYSSWQVGDAMPNSAGCVHSYLPSIEQIWHTLVDVCGVVANKNVGGTTPYPYKPQGIVAVYNVD